MKAQEPSHILVVDDEKSTASPHTKWLREQYIVSEANSQDAALTKLNEGIDIVILNCDTMEWAGLALLQEIDDRRHDQYVLVMTETEPEIDITSLPIDEYLVKPASHTEFANTVKRLIQLGTYDDLLQKHFSLVSKLTALHTTDSSTELAEDKRHTDLCNRIATLEANLDRITRELNEADYHAAFRAVVE